MSRNPPQVKFYDFYHSCLTVITEHREGAVRAELECDGKNIGDLTLKYKCDMEKINGLIQVG